MEGLGTILSVDKDNAKIKDDAFSIDIDENGNYILHVFIADFISHRHIKASQLIENRLQSDSFNQAGILKTAFSDFSLSEREEKPVFDFKFVISKDIEVLSFEASKKNIMIDIEMTHSDVADTIDEDSYLIDYLALAYELGEKLATKNKSQVDFCDNFERMEFPFPFPKEFLKLLNITLMKQCLDNKLPLIFFVYAKNHKFYNEYKSCYFASEIDSESDVYARFNSPIRSMDSLFNLMVYNDIVFNKNFDNIDSIQKYRSIVDGYHCMVLSYDDERRNGVKK